MRIKREELLAKLESVKAGLASQEIIEQTCSFIFHEGRLITYNDALTVSTDLVADFEGAVKAKELLQYLSKSKKKELDIGIKDGQFRLRSRGARVGVPIEDEIKIPLNEIETPTKWDPLPKDFAKGLGLCRHTTSNDATREILMCVNVSGQLMSSTDTYRMTQYGMTGKVPKKFNVLTSVAKQVAALKPTHYAINGGWLCFKKDDLIFSTRMPEATFPKISQYMTVEGTTVDLPVELVDILGRAKIFAEGEFAQDTSVTVSLKKNTLYVRGEGISGWVEEKESVKYDGPSFSFATNPDFLIESIQLRPKVVIGENAMLIKTKRLRQVIALTQATT